jgi:CcmD family protein
MMEVGGKIFVVALILALIFAGLGLFLLYLERKLTRLEKQIELLERENYDPKGSPVN